ncbi:MAG TPA: MoaD/ThiS family protein [Candidatus Norongarragalinales archaeon]|nr:MoaD/ThiS family protein [Candidatus Norongarragalinales archaeon]
MEISVFRDGKKLTGDFSRAKTIEQIVQQLSLNPETLVVKKNGKLVHPKSDLSDGDDVELVGIIYGG